MTIAIFEFDAGTLRVLGLALVLVVVGVKYKLGATWIAVALAGCAIGLAFVASGGLEALNEALDNHNTADPDPGAEATTNSPPPTLEGTNQ